MRVLLVRVGGASALIARPYGWLELSVLVVVYAPKCAVEVQKKPGIQKFY